MARACLPSLSRTFWSYLKALEADAQSLLGLIHEERLSLLEREINKILVYARKKEELVKRIANGEKRLAVIMEQILKKVGEGPFEDRGELVRSFKAILDYKDFLRFEGWFSRYKHTMLEVRKSNERNLRWASEGLKESVELSKILRGISRTDSALYNQNGQLSRGG